MSRLIDADALKRKAQRVATEAWKMKITGKVETILNQFIDWVDNAPTIDPVRKGKWIHKSGTLFATCSECGVVWGAYAVMNYCPDCGAKMEEGDSDG